MGYVDTVIADGAHLLLMLDDTSGTTATSEIGNTGTYVGAPTLGDPGPSPLIPLGATFNGSSQAVNLNANDAATLGWRSPPFSYELWFKKDGAASSTEWLYWQGNDNTANPMFGFILTNTVGSGQVITTIMRDAGGVVRVNSGDIQSTTNVTDNAWHQLVYTEDGSRASHLYIDGAEEDTLAAYPQNETDMDRRASLGRRRGSVVDGYFAGSIAAFSVSGSTSGGEWTPAQIAEHYELGTNLWYGSNAPMVMG